MLAEVTTVQFALTHVERLDESLKRLAEEDFDVVILDLLLPDSQGLNTFLQMHTAASDTPLLILTALDDETVAVKAVQSGAQDYLVKGEEDSHSLWREIRLAIERQRMWIDLQERVQELQASEAHLRHIVEEHADVDKSALGGLDSPEALMAIVKQCDDPDAAIATRSQQLIASLEYPQFVNLLNFILESGATDPTAREHFQILYKLKSRDLLKYILSFRGTHPQNRIKKRALARWLTELGILRQYIQVLLNLPGVSGLNPSPTAISSCGILAQFNPNVVLELAKLIKNVSPEEAIKGLAILEEIAEENKMVPRLLVGTVATPDVHIRSKAIKTLGKLSSSNIAICKRGLQDEDGRVRANTIESVWGTESPEIKEILLPSLEEPYPRARANAARIFYDMGDARGLETLMDMVNADDAARQASGVWMLGEIKATSAINRLKELAETDSESVARNAALALKKIGQALIGNSEDEESQE